MSLKAFDALALFQNLKIGDRIDVQDQEGDWFDAIIRNITDNKLICHFWGFANIWDTAIEFNPTKIAPVHTYSEVSKYADNEKILGECLWEILSKRNLLNENNQCTQNGYVDIQTQTGISIESMREYLENMEGTDDIHLKLCKYVQKNIIEMGMNLRIQELLENGVNCFGFDEEIVNNLKTIEHLNDNFKNIMSGNEIKPLNLENLSKIELPEIPDIVPINNNNNFSSTTNTNSTDDSANSHNSSYIDNNNNNNTISITNTNIMDTNAALIMMKMNEMNAQNNTEHMQMHNKRKRKQSVTATAVGIPPKKKQKTHEHKPKRITRVLVTKYDENSVKKGWMDIPTKDELQPGTDGKYRCSSLECMDKAPFKTYTTTVRHIMVEHQGFRYRCDFCREEHCTEVEFRSHSSLKIHLTNHHKLRKDDFQKFRIVLALKGDDGMSKKTQCSDYDEFKQWKRGIVEKDMKRNDQLHENEKQILKKVVLHTHGHGHGHKGKRKKRKKKKKKRKRVKRENGLQLLKDIAIESNISSSEDDNDNEGNISSQSMYTLKSEFELKSLRRSISENLGLNMENNASIRGKSEGNTNHNQSKHKDKAFMDRIDELIQNLEDPKTNKIALMKQKRKEKGKGKGKEKQRIIPKCDVCGRCFKNSQALGGHKKMHNQEWKEKLKAKTRMKQKQKEKKKQKQKEREKHSGGKSDSDYDGESEYECDDDEEYYEEYDIMIPRPPAPPPPPPPPQRIKTLKQFKRLRLKPFGPFYHQKLNMFDECNTPWIDNAQMSVSRKFGAVILHFDD